VDTATCWFGTFVFVLKPAQSIGSTTPTEVTCSFFLCFRQVLFSVSVRWNLSRGSLLHIIHMMVRRERHDIDYRNCQKMLLLLLSKYCLCKTQSKGRYHCRSCGLVLCGNCFKWRHLVSCHDGSMSQQVEGAVFFCLLTMYTRMHSIRSIQCRCNVLIWISAQRCDIVSFTKPPASCTSALVTLEKCCCWPWTRKVLHPLI
jgi:hypothetical protein